MKQFLERYEICLETIGPVYIGSGKDIGKKEYVFDRRNETAVVIDQQKLFKYLKKRNLLNDYEKFMLTGNYDLFRWMKENNIYPRDIDKIEAYRLDCSAVADINTVKNIQTFIRDAYGIPYIPGSSIKGALRNIILSEYIRENPDCRIASEIKNTVNDRSSKSSKSKNLLSGELKKTNEKYLCTLGRDEDRKSNAVNDIMSGIRVADSKSLPVDCLTLCQKVDENKDGNCCNMPILRECIKPGTVITAEMTIDRSLTDISIDFIEKAIAGYLERYNMVFLRHFTYEDQYNDGVIYLGGGVGFHNKTIMKDMFSDWDCIDLVPEIIDKNLPRKAKEEHKHFKDRATGVSPHIVKVTYTDDKYYQFGPCRVEFRRL